MNEQPPPRQIPVIVLWLGLIVFVLLAAAAIGRSNEGAALMLVLA
jgi:hypothetical protein